MEIEKSNLILKFYVAHSYSDLTNHFHYYLWIKSVRRNIVDNNYIYEISSAKILLLLTFKKSIIITIFPHKYFSSFCSLFDLFIDLS